MTLTRIAFASLCALALAGCSNGGPSKAEATQALREQLRAQALLMGLITGGQSNDPILAAIPEKSEITEIDCVPATGTPGFVCSYTWVTAHDEPIGTTDPSFDEDRFVKSNGAWRIVKS